MFAETTTKVLSSKGIKVKLELLKIDFKECETQKTKISFELKNLKSEKIQILYNKINLIEKENSKKFLMEKYTDIEIELIKYVKNSTINLNSNKETLSKSKKK